MQLSIIVAMGRDRSIGADNQLLWHLPQDLKRFRQLTTGHTIVMGRNTWHSLPCGALPNRRNVVVSRTLDEAQGAEVYRSVEEALRELEGEAEVFVIGGGQIYEQLLPRVSKLYLTVVEAEFAHADTFFPKIDWAAWHIVQEERVPADERNSFASIYYELERK